MTELTTAPPTPPVPPASTSQTIDFARPFRFVFEDPEWVKKVVIGGLFYLASVVVVGIFFVGGYMVRLARNVIRGEARPLPEWNDLGNYFVEGVKLFVVGFVYALPMVLVWGVAFGGMAAAGAFADEQLEGPLAALFGCSMVIFILLILVYSVFIPAALLMYAATGSISQAFDVGRVARFIRHNPGNYLLAYLVHLVANFLSQFGIVLLCIGLFFTAFWSVAVATYAFAEAYRLAKVR